MREFQNNLNAFSPDLTTLRILGRSLQHLQQVQRGVQDVNLVRELVRSLAKLSPSPNDGVDVKQMAITQLQELTGQGSASDIRAIRNIILKPYPNTSSFFTETIVSWMNRRLLIESDRDPNTVAQTLESAFSESNSEWGQAVNANLATWLNNWNEKTASAVWQWWQQSPSLVQQLKKYLPDHPLVEQNLVTKCPSRLSSSLGEMVITLSQEQKWLSLHAVTHLALFSPLVAIKKHLEFDQSPTFEDAIHEMARRVESKTLLDAALDIGEHRLLCLAGSICAKESNFLAELDLNIREWRIIWYESMLVSRNPWQGINDPLTTMNSVLSRVLQQLPVENNLLEQLGQTKYGDLTEHLERSKIWQFMPSTVAAPFLEQTAEGWLQRLSTKAQQDTFIEQPLRNAILDSGRLAKHFQKNQISLLSFSMRLFFTFPELGEVQLDRYCLNSLDLPQVNISQLDAYQLGQLIKHRRWKAAATKVYRLVQWKRISQLNDALRECYELLSWFDQGHLYLSGLLPEFKRSDNDWWMSFSELATELYPNGPNEQEFWTRVGGDKSILKISGSGRENWQDAARKL
ncbi:MAG TPA: hypothetical protein P5280_03865, partial [Cyclobacteriaceae bacterium]|nr:hypothetical protein [Cyclobacteriaceae bacterium]